MENNKMKTMPDLSQFYGTFNYHKLTMGEIVGTDGIAHLCKEVGCFWLMDIVGSVYNTPKIQEHKTFIVWRIIVKDEQAIVCAYSDCNADGTYPKSKELYYQKVNYTDFPKGTFEFYQCGNVVMLKGEY